MSRQSMSVARFLLSASLLCWVASGCAPATKPAPSAKPTAAAAKDSDHGSDDHADHAHGDEHAGHAHPATLADGIAELEKVAADVAAKLATGADDAADEAIHLAGHVVEDLKQLLAKQEGIATDAREAAGKALDDLYEAFDKVDLAMHSGAEDVKTKAAEAHASVQETIAAAVTSLKERFIKEDK